MEEKELLHARLSGKAGLVYKEGNNLYFTDELPIKDVFFPDATWGKHKCAGEDLSTCKFLSAGKGGCQKVIDPPAKGYSSDKAATIEDWIVAKRIEKYDWIEKGFEVFNAGGRDCLRVMACKKYKKNEYNKRTMSGQKQTELLFSLHDFIKPLESIEEMNNLLKKATIEQQRRKEV